MGLQLRSSPFPSGTRCSCGKGVAGSRRPLRLWTHKEKSIPGGKGRQLPGAFYSQPSHLHPCSALTQGDRPRAKLAAASQGKRALKSSSQRRGGETGRAGIFHRSHPVLCSLLPQARVLRREARLLPDGLDPSRSWAVGRQEQSLAKPFPGLAAAPCHGSSTGSRSDPPGSRERDGG